MAWGWQLVIGLTLGSIMVNTFFISIRLFDICAELRRIADAAENEERQSFEDQWRD